MLIILKHGVRHYFITFLKEIGLSAVLCNLASCIRKTYRNYIHQQRTLHLHQLMRIRVYRNSLVIRLDFYHLSSITTIFIISKHHKDVYDSKLFYNFLHFVVLPSIDFTCRIIINATKVLLFLTLKFESNSNFVVCKIRILLSSRVSNVFLSFFLKVKIKLFTERKS